MRPAIHFHRAFVAGLLLALLAAVVLARSSEELFHRRAEVDRWGRVVRDEAGRRITLPRPESPDPSPPETSFSPHDGVPVPEAVGLPIALEWHRSTFGTGIGLAGLHAVDLDGDGARDIVASASSVGFFGNAFWYVLEHRGSEYVHTWTSLAYPSGIQSLSVANFDSAPGPEVLVGSGNKIQVYNGATRALEATITTAASEIRGLRVADIDGDGHVELVFCDASNLYVYDAATRTARWIASGLGGEDVAVGNVDDDAALEIVVGRGSSTGYVVDGVSRAVEWANAWGFGNLVRLGELDGYGRQEVVSGYFWDGIRIFDAEARSLAASVSVFNLGSLQVLDVEGDGPLEIVYGDAQWGSVHVLDGATRAQKWDAPNPEHGTTDLAVGDVDGDGVNELMWGAGYSSTGPDHLYVLDTVSRVREWQSLDFNGPFLALSYGDVDADGRSEILSGSFHSDSGYGAGLIFVHDAVTHDLEYQTTSLNWTGLWRIRNANVDGDPQQEIFVTGSPGILICYDGLTHAEQWRATIANGLAFGSMTLADVDSDGQLEVVAGVNGESTGAPGIYVYVFNAATGALEWQSPSLSGIFVYLSLLRVANVDGDPNPEIVVASYGRAVYLLDGVTHAVLHLGAHDVTALETPDRDGNGVAEIVIGTAQGQLQVLEPVNGAVVQTIGTYGDQIDGLAVADVTGDSVPDYVFGAANEVRIYDGTAPSRLLARTGVIGNQVGKNDSLFIADVDADGSLELVVSLGYTGFRVYEAAPLTLSVADVSVAEGDSGQTAANFTVTLSAPSAQAVTVHYSTADGTARTGSDYLSVSGLLTIPPTQTSGVISVPVLGDQASEGSETFSVILSAETGAAILDGEATGVILDDEGGPALSIGDVTVMEGQSAVFTVTLSPVNLSQTVTVDYRTAGVTATSGVDFAFWSGTLAFAPGVATMTISVPVYTDAAIDGGETFSVELSNAVNAVLTDSQGIGTILDVQMGDFNGDGKPDILWRNDTTGDDLVWFMNGPTLAGGAVLTAVTDVNWNIVGATDFNADGKPDILWRNQATGDNLVWFMNGTAISGGALLTSVPDSNWRIGATGDFNADGEPDILWRNRASGDNLVWFMNGTALAGGAVLTPVADTSWVVGGVGDFNGDAKADILWRNQASGDNLVWLMNGTVIAGGAMLLPVSDLSRAVAGVGDFNGDGKPDVLWRSQASGENLIWFLNGTTLTGGAVLPAVSDPSWKIVGPR